MRDFIVKCDGCNKEIIGSDKSQPVFYHNLRLKFKTYMIDPHTGQEEEMSNMVRTTENTYCRFCLDKLTNKMEEFIKEVSPEPREIIEEYNEVVNKLQSSAIDGKEAMEKRK